MDIDTRSRRITQPGEIFSDLGFGPEEAETLQAESQRRIAAKRAAAADAQSTQPPTPNRGD